MNKKVIVFVCKRVKFYTLNDEKAFFDYIKRLDFVEKFWGSGDEIYLQVDSGNMHDCDLRDFMALFYRYKIDMKQLRCLINEENRGWLYERSVKPYWHQALFGVQEVQYYEEM